MEKEVFQGNGRGFRWILAKGKQISIGFLVTKFFERNKITLVKVHGCFKFVTSVGKTKMWMNLVFDKEQIKVFVNHVTKQFVVN